MSKPFNPEDHKTWAEGFLLQMNHNSEWQLPSNNQVYRIDKQQKKLTMIRGRVDGTFEMNKQVFALLGYTVESAPVETGRGKSVEAGHVITTLLNERQKQN